MGFFSGVLGLCSGTGGLRDEITRPKKSTKLDIHGRKGGNDTVRSQDMIETEEDGFFFKKNWFTVHTFRVFVAVLWTTSGSSLKKVNSSFTVNDCRDRSRDHITTGSHPNMNIIVY
jgi:hypothetical protein